ncbi:hypothetical protein EB001_20920 [bacterium]|nr:hypothetical protein [bacterium]
MNNKILLIVASLLIIVGLVKPDFSNLGKGGSSVDQIVVVSPPSDPTLKEACSPVIEALKNGASSRVKDGKRLSNLSLDIARLIELDGEDVVIKTTDEIRYAVSLAGPMLRMDIKGKYPDLAKNSQAVIVAGIGDDNVPLDDATRHKAVESFQALAWAYNEGSK